MSRRGFYDRLIIAFLSPMNEEEPNAFPTY